MIISFEKKNILVVGASKGIGRAIALAFAKEKANVTIIARSIDLLETLKNEMLNLGPSSIDTVPYDVIGNDSAVLASELIKKRHYDVVVHCVGGSLTSRDYLGPKSDFLYALDFNALHAIAMNSIIMKDMISNGIHGKIIHVSSISAKMLRGNPLYASAKAYLNAYITSVGRAVASQNIDLMSVMPGAVSFPDSYWDLKIRNNDPAVKEFLNQHQAIGRFGTVEEIANFVLVLASDQISFVCASNLEIDGGNM